MALTLKDLLVGAITGMATRSGVSGSLGRVGLAGMAATHAIPGQTGVTGQIGEFVRELGKLPSTLREFNAALQNATMTLGKTGGQAAGAGGSNMEKMLQKLSGLKEFAAGAAANEATSGATAAMELSATEEAGAVAAGAGAGLMGGGPLGAAAAAAMVLAAIEAAKLAINLRGVNAALLESQRTVGQYNGGIMIALAQLDIGRIQRKIDTGKDTEESAKFLAKQQNRLEENLRPIDAWFTNIKNNAAAYAAEAESVILEGIFGKQPNRKSELSPLATMAKEIADGKYGGRQYPPIDKAHIRASNK